MGVAARVGRKSAAPSAMKHKRKRRCSKSAEGAAAFPPYAADPLVAHDGAAFVAYPIGKTEVIHPDVLKPGADRRGGTQGCPAAALAVGDDMIARAMIARAETH